MEILFLTPTLSKKLNLKNVVDLNVFVPNEKPKDKKDKKEGLSHSSNTKMTHFQ